MTRRLITIAAAAFAASACNVGANAEERDAGASVSRSYPISAFDRIEVAGPYDVAVTTGGQPGVSATGGDKMLDETEVLVEGNVLKIRPKKRNGFNFNWGTKGKAQFTVMTSMLHGASILGSGAVKVDKVDGDFKGSIGGSGDLALAAIKGGTIDFVIGGSGSITAAGTAQSTSIKIGGAGEVDAARLVSKTASVAIGGAGNAKANASETAKVSVAGAGDVVISGGAKCSISKVGAGNVTCG